MPSANAANRLIAHYLVNARRLPWRLLPGEGPPDPYRIWLSEVMLQQTTVAAVAPRFARFVGRWPTVRDLAAASDAEILTEWAGLGYYARARNLIACARQVAASGAFPDSAKELRELPGIGDYTAAAIAAIAFGERIAAVDTNVRRVTARLFGLENPSLDEIRDRLDCMVPADSPGEFAQAMMDLGATICRPANPACTACPLATDCTAFLTGEPTRYPAAKPKAVKPHRHGIALWTERAGQVRLIRRPARGLLGGMAALPGPDWSLEQQAMPGPPLGRVRHVFTHFSLDLTVIAAGGIAEDGWWQPIDSLAEAGLPTLYRRAVEAVLANRLRQTAA